MFSRSSTFEVGTVRPLDRKLSRQVDKSEIGSVIRGSLHFESGGRVARVPDSRPRSARVRDRCPSAEIRLRVAGGIDLPSIARCFAEHAAIGRAGVADPPCSGQVPGPGDCAVVREGAPSISPNLHALHRVAFSQAAIAHGVRRMIWA